MIAYLGNEAANARAEYSRARSAKPRGVPYFVREHVLHYFCDYMLEQWGLADHAFEWLEQAHWYDAEQLEFDHRIVAEMKREANLAFGRWYRRAKDHLYGGQSPAVTSYHALVRSLIDKAAGGDARRWETAFFLLRHTAAPPQRGGAADAYEVRSAVIDAEFADIFAELNGSGAIGALATRYPIRVSLR